MFVAILTELVAAGAAAVACIAYYRKRTQMRRNVAMFFLVMTLAATAGTIFRGTMKPAMAISPEAIAGKTEAIQATCRAIAQHLATTYSDDHVLLIASIDEYCPIPQQVSVDAFEEAFEACGGGVASFQWCAAFGGGVCLPNDLHAIPDLQPIQSMQDRAAVLDQILREHPGTTLIVDMSGITVAFDPDRFGMESSIERRPRVLLCAFASFDGAEQYLRARWVDEVFVSIPDVPIESTEPCVQAGYFVTFDNLEELRPKIQDAYNAACMGLP